VLCFGMAIVDPVLGPNCRLSPLGPRWRRWCHECGHQPENALGLLSYLACSCVAALLKPLARAIAQIPSPIAAAMLAGVLLKYALGVPAAALSMPLFVLPLIIVFFGLRLSFPLFAVPVVVVLGVAMAAFAGSFTGDCCAIGFTRLEWTTPQFDWTTILSLGVPLFLVTMASQNLPGFAVLRAGGYEPPVTSCLLTTGLASMAMAPFGSHSVNMAAITASLVTGPDTHEDPAKRWLVAWPYLVLYVAVGLAAALLVQILGSLPAALITTIVGLALFSPLMGSVVAMLKEPRDIESALITFLVTASGVTFYGVGSAFWGLVAGLVLFGVRHVIASKK
jgi:benzoate membrane transport protein